MNCLNNRCPTEANGECHQNPLGCECRIIPEAEKGASAPVDSQSDGSVYETLQLIEKASNHIDDLCQGKKRWTMSVPVDELNDSDCILQNALTEAKKLIEKQNDQGEPHGK